MITALQITITELKIKNYLYGLAKTTQLFLSRVSTLTRDIDIAILSVCP